MNLLERMFAAAGLIRRRYDDAPAKQAENEAIAAQLRASGFALADERKIGQIRQHYDAKPALWGTPFAAYAVANYRAFYPN